MSVGAWILVSVDTLLINYCPIVCIDVLVPEVGLGMSQHAGKYI